MAEDDSGETLVMGAKNIPLNKKPD